MTDAQRIKLYIPHWLGLAKALDWQMAGGRLVADLAAQMRGAGKWPEHAGQAIRQIITAAEAMAAAERRAATAEDLRYGLNLVATGGRHTSSKKFSNSDVNEFLRLCKMLRNPWEDLTATIAYLNPAEDNRKRTIQHLRHLANEGRLISISRNAWGTGDWESLPQERLDALIAEIKKNAWSRFPRRKQAKQPF